MIEDTRALTAQLAADPSSLVFLALGETLRRRGQLDAAQKVALAGLSHYPHLPDAHDLYARILCDRGDFERAFDEWDMALRLDPELVGALKGIGFLYFRAGGYANALQHLQAGVTVAPGDEGLVEAITRVQEAAALARGRAPSAAQPAPAVTPQADLMAALEDMAGKWLLVDAGGLPLKGKLGDQDDAVAALVAGTAREASRTAKLLQLGEWRSLLIECTDADFCLLKPTEETFLLEAGAPGEPVGQLALLADRAARATRAWLESVG